MPAPIAILTMAAALSPDLGVPLVDGAELEVGVGVVDKETLSEEVVTMSRAGREDAIGASAKADIEEVMAVAAPKADSEKAFSNVALGDVATFAESAEAESEVEIDAAVPAGSRRRRPSEPDRAEASASNLVVSVNVKLRGSGVEPGRREDVCDGEGEGIVGISV